ncbi:MAG: hypothetical protein HQK53_18865, partial [Oligoflexia bacterium]|nr:hypothetical protein [Oligoflexia bacterium]
SFPDIEKEMYGKWTDFLENETRRVKAGKRSQVHEELKRFEENEKQKEGMECDGTNEKDNDSDYIDLDEGSGEQNSQLQQTSQSQHTTNTDENDQRIESLKNSVAEVIKQYETKSSRGRGKGRAPTGSKVRRGKPK